MWQWGARLSFRSLPQFDGDRHAVVLVPKYLLRDLPTINTDSFADYLWTVHSVELRERFNVEVKKELLPRIREVARRNPEWVREYVAAQEAQGSRSYDFRTDPTGFGVYSVGYEWARSIGRPSMRPRTERQVLAFVALLGHHYKEQIEDRAGWELLWGLHRANQMIPEVTNTLDDVDPTVSHLDRAACTS
jgi:hypothetical protein